jgi:hypothetical protein
MRMSIPSKQDCFYVLEMLESGLINFSYTHPWAEQFVVHLDPIPTWLCDIATKKYQGDQTKALREYIFAEPLEPPPDGLEKFHLACLWIRYERRELSWATFLSLAGDRLDRSNGDWDCGTPYHYLNVYEDAYFSHTSERQTQREYLADQDLVPWIALARQKFEPFKKMRRAKKAVQR